MTSRLIKDGELFLYGYVGGSIRWTEDGIEETGFTDEDVLAAIAELSGDIVVRINSAGGVAFQGIAIYNALKSYDGQVTIYVDALAGSAASVIAMAGDTVIMRTGSMLMIHNPAGITIGTAADHRNTANTLDEIAAAAAEIYAAKTKRPIAEMLDIMAAETWMRGAIAKSLGFADEVRAADDAELSAPVFDYSLFKNAPDHFRASDANRAAAEPGKPAALAAPHKEVTMTTPAPAAPAIQPAPTIKDITQDVFSRCRSAKLTMEETEKVITLAAGDIDKARDAIIDALAARDTSSEVRSHHSATVTADASEKFVEGVSKALMQKKGLPGGERNEFSGYRLDALARMSLENRGIKTGSMKPLQMIGEAFVPVMVGGQHSTSDFAQVLGNVANRSMLRGFEEQPETFTEWTRKGTLPDFRSSTRIGVGQYPSLEKVLENAEFKYVTLGDYAEKIQLATYGNLFAISRQAIINDDMDVFTTIPRRQGAAARRTVAELAVKTLTDNAALSDGVALFHANHKNLLTGNASSLTHASGGILALSAAVSALRQQVVRGGKAGTVLNIRPAILLVPSALEVIAKQLVSSPVWPGKSNNEPNPMQNIARVVVEPRLDAVSTTAWYLIGDPASVDTLEIAYLDGEEAPFLDQKDGWTIDGTEYKVRIDAGAAPLAWEGMQKNAGA